MSDTFAPFGRTHLCVVVVSVLLWVATVSFARRVRGTARERRFRGAFAVFILVVNVGWSIYLLTPAKFDLRWSLPIQLCDFAWIAAAWSMLSRGGPARLRHALVYYWGMGLGTLGYATPTLALGPATPSFWAFWITHWQIVGVALLQVAAFEVRPSWRSWRRVLLVTLVCGGLVTAFNVSFATSYWFTGRDVPENPTLLDLLGSWPTRLVWMFLLVAAELALFTVPFRRLSPGEGHNSRCAGTE